MGVVHCASCTVAGVVCTCVSRWGAVGSQVSLTWTIVAGPRRIAFVAVACLSIVGRFDALSGRWSFPVRLEADTVDGASRGARPRVHRPVVVALPRPT